METIDLKTFEKNLIVRPLRLEDYDAVVSIH